MFTLVVIEKGGAQKRFEFDEEMLTVGRVQGNHVVLQRGNVSKRHAKIELKDNAFMVADAGSTNGTYVNGRRVHEPTRLFKGDRVYIGDFILTLEGHDALEPVGGDDPPSKSANAADSVPAPQEQAHQDSHDDESTERVFAFPEPILPRSPGALDKEAAPDAGRVSATRGSELRAPVRPTAKRSQAASSATSKTSNLAAPLSNQGGDEDELRSGKALTGLAAEMENLVDTVLDQASRQVKRVSRTLGPAKVDSGTAGRIRIVIDELVGELHSRGRIPPGIEPGELKGKALRSAVYLGPLADWLDDADVRMIRAIRPDSCHLLRSDGWVEAATAFVSEEEMADAARNLSAGLEVREGGAPGISRFRLEEGYLVFSALPPGAPYGPAIVIDKTAATKGPELTTPVAIKKVLMPVVREALSHKARIGVVGASRLARLSVISELLHLLAQEAFVVAVEDLPLAVPDNRDILRLSVRSRRIEGDEGSSFGSLLFHALELEPDWLVATGGEWKDIPHVLSVSAGRQSVLAELPLGGAHRLDRELAVSVAAAGISMSAENAATLLEGAFDVIITVGRNRKGASVIERAVSCKVDQDGRWSPESLFDRGVTQ